MKITIAFIIAMFGVAMALPTGTVVPILQRTEVRDEAGQYAISYLTGDGIAVAEQGALKPTADGKDNVLVQQGQFAYNGPDGRTYKIEYIADENGFQPTGDHIPRP